MLRVRTQFQSPVGGPYLSTLYFTPAVDDLQAAIAAVGDVSVFWGACDAFMPISVNWATDAAVDVIDPTTGTITDIHGTSPAAGTGGSASDLLPAASQGLIRWTTNDVVNGRLIRGKTFVPAPVESSSTAGVPTQGYLDGIGDAADALVTANFLAVWHRPTPAAPASGSAHLVTSASVWEKWAVLTSRRD